MVRHWPLVLIVAAYLILGSLFATRIPAWQNPDEPAHYNYTRQLAQTGAFPVIEANDWTAGLVPIGPDVKDVPLNRLTYEDHQPPLFYTLAVPIFSIFNGQLIALRLFSLLIGALTIILAYLTVVTIFPTHPQLAVFAVAFVALLPQHVAIMASFNNDSLSEALLALVVLLSVRLIMNRGKLTTRNLVYLALVVGLCFITKAQAYLALPVALIGVFLAAVSNTPSAATFSTPDMREKQDAGGRGFSRVITPATNPAEASVSQPKLADAVLRAGLIILGVSVLIGLPWWIHSIQLYGGADFLGLQRHNAVVIGQTTTAEEIAKSGIGGLLVQLLRTTFQSFWGQFGWMSIPLDQRIYLILLAFTFVSAALFVLWWLHSFSAKRRLQGQAHTKSGASIYSPYLVLTPQQSRALTLLAWLALFTLLAYVWYNLQFVQHQGRYLYPGLIPIATAFALGWGFIFSRREAIGRWLWLALLLVLAALDLYLLFRVILPQMGV
jgi:hypothetical protein